MRGLPPSFELDDACLRATRWRENQPGAYSLREYFYAGIVNGFQHTLPPKPMPKSPLNHLLSKFTIGSAGMQF